MRRLLLLLAGLALVAVACSGGDDGAFPDDAFVIRASSDLAVGPDRVLLAIGTPSNERPARPEIGVTIEVYPEGEPDSAQRVPGVFMWAVPDVSGLYRADVEFDAPGVWVASVVPDDGSPLEPTLLNVAAAPLTPAVGAAAPGSASPIAADVADLAEITTDRAPDPRFYELSIADAVTSGRASVIVFATPRFCQTAVCGPTLDEMKEVADDFPDVNWLHVEVFTNLDDPDNLELVPAVTEWGLPSEPWVFVVGADGVVTGRFEGVVDPSEIEAALGGA